jgi:RsiW-degrading membrane proteinase PrsW (M82 family)
MVLVIENSGEIAPDSTPPATAVRIACEHCGVEVEAGAFCSACGAHLAHTNRRRAARRIHAFAAGPHQGVYHPAVFSTILPHLQRHRMHLYRWGMLLGVVLVVAALFLANAGLATVLAALIVPILYVAYIYHADVHEGEPLVVIGSTVLCGALLGVVMAALTRYYLGHFALTQIIATAQGFPRLSFVLFVGVTVPLISEFVKLAGPLFLRRWPQFRNEVMDGAVFGVAAGVGFAAGSTLVNYWPIIKGGYAPNAGAGLADWTATLIGLAIIRPLVQGTTSALIGAGIWAAALRRGDVILPVVVGFAGALLYSLGELLLLNRGTLTVLSLHLVILAVLLLMLRRTIHQALLFDARALGLEGGTLDCPNCHQPTEARVFCTHCGTALRAQPKHFRPATS